MCTAHVLDYQMISFAQVVQFHSNTIQYTQCVCVFVRHLLPLKKTLSYTHWKRIYNRKKTQINKKKKEMRKKFYNQFHKRVFIAYLVQK